MAFWKEQIYKIQLPAKIHISHLYNERMVPHTLNNNKKMFNLVSQWLTVSLSWRKVFYISSLQGLSHLSSVVENSIGVLFFWHKWNIWLFHTVWTEKWCSLLEYLWIFFIMSVMFWHINHNLHVMTWLLFFYYLACKAADNMHSFKGCLFFIHTCFLNWFSL